MAKKERFALQDELVFLPLGGSGEIGMNFNAYGFGPPDDRQWIIAQQNQTVTKVGINFSCVGRQSGHDGQAHDMVGHKAHLGNQRTAAGC